jgi:hypothetical protein
MDIAPVSLVQVVAGRDGRQYEISEQAGHIAARLREVDPTLRVEFNDRGMFFVVVQMVDRGGAATADELAAVKRELVLRVPMSDWDDRVVREMEMRAHEIRHGRSAADRLDESDARRSADAEYRLDQEVRERAYPLFRSFQRGTLGINPRIYLGGRGLRRSA